MNDKNIKLDEEFNAAVELINSHKEAFPADTLLRLYALYKRATKNSNKPKSKKPLISAFKTNALFQLQHLNENEAKKEYIKLVNNYFLYRK